MIAFALLLSSVAGASGIQSFVIPPESHVTSVTPDGYSFIGTEGALTIWNIKTGRPKVVRFPGDDSNKPVTQLASADGKRVVRFTSEGSGRVYDVESGSELFRLSIPWFPTFRGIAKFSLDNRLLAIGGDSTYVFDATNGKLLTAVGISDARDLDFSRDGRSLVAASSTKALVWDIANNTELASLPEPKGSICQVCFSPDGSRVMTASYGGRIEEWDAHSGASLNVFAAQVRTAFEKAVIGYADDGTPLAIPIAFSDVSVCNVRTHKSASPVLKHPATVMSCAFSPDGKSVFTNCFGVRRWNIKTGRMEAQYGNTNVSETVRFSKSGGVLLINDLNGIRIDLRTGRIQTEDVIQKNNDGEAISDDLRTLFIVRWSGDYPGEYTYRLEVHNLVNGSVRSLPIPGPPATLLHGCAPDGRWYVTAELDESRKVAKFKRRSAIDGHIISTWTGSAEDVIPPYPPGREEESKESFTKRWRATVTPSGVELSDERSSHTRATIIALQKGWLVVDEAGHFDASALDDVRTVYVVLNGKPAYLDELAPKRRVKGLLKRILN